MASYTTNLNLLKKDPVADAADTFNIQTMLNDNWDKIDAAMAAAKSAEEYDAASTYALGSYCTKDGKLYKCTTAITAAETWNAAHWAETTIGAEIAAAYAALTAHTGNHSNPHGVTPAQIGAATTTTLTAHTGNTTAHLTSLERTAWNGKANTVTLTCTVPVSWTASGDYFYQNVSVPGMLAADNPIADILPGGDNAANKLYAEAWGKVLRIDTGDNLVQIWCTEAPTVSFPVQFKVVRG